MGMSIEKSLEWLISRKEHYEMDDNCQELAQALDTAIETMRKYQIIVNDLKACEQDGMEFISVGFLKEIVDGKID